jgi:hypothetical protein
MWGVQYRTSTLDLVSDAVEEAFPSTRGRLTHQYALPDVEYLLGSMVAEQYANVRQTVDHSQGTNRGISVQAAGIQRGLHAWLEHLEKLATAVRELQQDRI